ncbi:unnamed protein product, partial [Ectocarpus sp. 4 AP-2014]
SSDAGLVVVDILWAFNAWTHCSRGKSLRGLKKCACKPPSRTGFLLGVLEKKTTSSCALQRNPLYSGTGNRSGIRGTLTTLVVVNIQLLRRDNGLYPSRRGSRHDHLVFRHRCLIRSKYP